MADLIYESKPYVITVIGGVTVVNPAPWWGIVSGTVLVALGVLILYMRKQSRA